MFGPYCRYSVLPPGAASAFPQFRFRLSVPSLVTKPALATYAKVVKNYFSCRQPASRVFSRVAHARGIFVK
jgi:hypothetical protein